MFIPLALGTIVALIVAPRRQFWYILAAAFVSGALAAVAPQYYWYFVPMYLVALLLWAMRVENPRLMGYVMLIAAGLLVWLSDNSIINYVFSMFMRALAELLVAAFGAVAQVIGITTYAALAGAALAWSYAGRRLLRISFETPLAAAAVYYLAYIIIVVIAGTAAKVAAGTPAGNAAQPGAFINPWLQQGNETGPPAGSAPSMGQIAVQAISMAVALIGLYRLNEAFKGDTEAAVDAAVALPFISAAFPELAAAITPIAALLAILDIAWAAVDRRYAATSVALALGLASVHA